MAQLLIRHYSPDPLYHAAFANMRRRPLIRDGITDPGKWVAETSETFRRSFVLPEYVKPGSLEARSLHRQALLSWYEKHCKIFTSNEGNDRRGGFAILHGELQLLHHVDPGKGDWLVRQAVAEGAMSLNCFEVPHLLELYKRNGFVTAAVLNNTDNPNGPRVHYMEIK